VVVRDDSVPGSRRVELELPGGGRVRLAEVRDGWAMSDDPVAGDPVWPTLGAAAEALSGRRRDQEGWIARLEEFATPLGRAVAAPLPAEEEARLAALARRRPGVRVDGPRAHDSGGWYVFVGGLPGDAWVMEHGETPLEAARAAIARAEALLGEP
jgi:hypothetical protein